MNEGSAENWVTTTEKELQNALHREQQRNMQLKEMLDHSVKKNSDYKRDHNALQQRVSDLSELMKQNVRIFHELFRDTQNALHLSPFTSVESPTIQISEKPQPQTSREALPSANPRPGRMEVTKRRQLDIEPLNLQEIRQSLDDEFWQDVNLKNGSTHSEANEHLTTILEESTAELNSMEEAVAKIEHVRVRLSCPATNEELSVTSEKRITSSERALVEAKEAYVRLTRLPYEVVQQHLYKEDVADDSVDVTAMEPHFTSTPFKLETTKWSASHLPNQFVNTRKTYKKEKVDNSSVKQEPGSCKEVRNLMTDTIEGKEVAGPSTSNGRPTRSTRPKHLKEPSLRRKLRRS